MQAKTHPIEIAGRFLGLAVAEPAAWRFVATDPAVEALNGAVFPTPTETQRIVGEAFLRSRHAADFGVPQVGG